MVRESVLAGGNVREPKNNSRRAGPRKVVYGEFSAPQVSPRRDAKSAGEKAEQSTTTPTPSSSAQPRNAV
jgi:hypothetical protein